MGSSPISVYVESLFAIKKPFVLRLYPLLKVAILYFSPINLIRYSMCGDFPVPPTVIFPTEIVFVKYSFELRKPISNKRFLVFVTIPYRKANGSKRTLKKSIT